MSKLKQNKEILIIVLVGLSIIFYWFQLRPINIKKGCSWVTETIPADMGITKEQAEINKKIYDKCVASDWVCEKPAEIGRIGLMRITKESPPQPEKEITREATKNEYERCLRGSGL